MSTGLFGSVLGGRRIRDIPAGPRCGCIFQLQATTEAVMPGCNACTQADMAHVNDADKKPLLTLEVLKIQTLSCALLKHEFRQLLSRRHACWRSVVVEQCV